MCKVKTTKPQNLCEVGDKGLQEEGGWKNIAYVFGCLNLQSGTYYDRAVSGLTILEHGIRMKKNKEFS